MSFSNATNKKQKHFISLFLSTFIAFAFAVTCTIVIAVAAISVVRWATEVVEEILTRRRLAVRGIF